MRFQFQVDGREAGKLRKRWEDAAEDAVQAGYASWGGGGTLYLDSSQGAEIARVEPTD